MLFPLLDASWQGGTGGNDADSTAEEQEEAELLSSALAADDHVDAKIGGQVGAARVPLGLWPRDVTSDTAQAHLLTLAGTSSFAGVLPASPGPVLAAARLQDAGCATPGAQQAAPAMRAMAAASIARMPSR